jgi:O-antigen ligase
MPAANPPQRALALVGLAAGLALAAVMARLGRPTLALVGVVLVAGIAGLLATGGGTGSAPQTVAAARVNLASPDRTGALHAALQLVAQHPLTGTGPGQANLRWKETDHGTHLYVYVHNEYLQVAAELGLVGLALLAILLAAMARLLWGARPPGHPSGTWAGGVAATAAFALHSGFDFVWHLPAIVLTVMLLIGVLLPGRVAAPADQQSVPVQAKEPDENQAH